MNSHPLSQHSCANCSAPLEPEYRYCPQCSQKTNLHRLNLRDILHDAIHYFTHADKGFIGLMKDLATKTGRVANEYVTGKRKKYFPPLNFFLIAGTICVLIASAANPPVKYNAMDDAVKVFPKIRQAPKRVQDNVLSLYERKHEAFTLMTKYSNTMLMIALPVFCLIYWLFYKRERFNYTEHLIANMYMGGFNAIVTGGIFAPVGLIFGIREDDPTSMSMNLEIAKLVFQVGYSSVFYYRFMEKRTTLAALKAVGVSMLGIVFWLAIGVGLLFLYILHGFW